MQTCNLHIVALPYYEVGECLDTFFAEAIGRCMTLRLDPTNGHDVKTRVVRNVVYCRGFQSHCISTFTAHIRAAS